MSNAKQRSEVVRYWWSKAEKSLESAQREFGAGEHSFAINRIYYAAFYGASAVLLERHHSFKKHSGVRSAFHREIIKTGLVDIKWGKLYDQLFEDRQEGDYLELISFDPEYVGFKLKECSELLENIRPLIASISGQSE